MYTESGRPAEPHDLLIPSRCVRTASCSHRDTSRNKNHGHTKTPQQCGSESVESRLTLIRACRRLPKNTRLQKNEVLPSKDPKRSLHFLLSGNLLKLLSCFARPCYLATIPHDPSNRSFSNGKPCLEPKASAFPSASNTPRNTLVCPGFFVVSSSIQTNGRDFSTKNQIVRQSSPRKQSGVPLFFPSRT